MAAPDLADLDAFAAVARARSFRGAASLQGVSASGYSEAVRRLESRLGVRLLNRTTRSVTPTEAGERLLARLGPALSEVAAALDAVNSFRDAPTGALRLNVPSIVARAVLPPIVSAFLKSHPGVTLEVIAQDTFIDVLAAGFDAGVRYEERLERDMIAVPLGPRRQRFACAASPAYLAEHGRPKHPRDLLRHACIAHRFASGRIARWEFERGDETVRIVPSGPLIADTLALEVQAAVDGVGVISTFEEFLADAIASGALVPVLPEWQQSFSGPYLYYPSRRHMPAPLRAFVDFIKSRPVKASSAKEPLRKGAASARRRSAPEL
jgi:DNA-binding transcriptional LysR family regulator